MATKWIDVEHRPLTAKEDAAFERTRAPRKFYEALMMKALEYFKEHADKRRYWFKVPREMKGSTFLSGMGRAIITMNMETQLKAHGCRLDGADGVAVEKL